MPATPIPGRHDQKVAVVTGAASGIGAAISRRFVAEGGRVVGGDVNDEALREIGQELNDAFTGVTADVTREADVARLVQTALDAHGRVDAGFNVAGASRGAPIIEMSEEDWDFTVDLCLKGVFFAMKHEARAMMERQAGGTIVNVASLNSRVPMFFGAAYSAAKAGVASLGQSGALELADHNIRVATVSPGLTETPLVAPIMTSDTAVRLYMERIPLKRPGTPEDMAAAALFLASEDASYITGINLFVDGGWEQSGYPDLRPLLAELLESAESGNS